MKRISLTDLRGRPVFVEQDSFKNIRFNPGDILRDLSYISSYPLYVVVGFTRDFQGEIEILWYTKPSFLISNSNGNGGEFGIRVRPVIGNSTWISYTLKNSNLPWLRVLKRNPTPRLSKKKIFSSCLEILKIQYNLY